MVRKSRNSWSRGSSTSRPSREISEAAGSAVVMAPPGRPALVIRPSLAPACRHRQGPRPPPRGTPVPGALAAASAVLSLRVGTQPTPKGRELITVLRSGGRDTTSTAIAPLRGPRALGAYVTPRVRSAWPYVMAVYPLWRVAVVIAGCCGNPRRRGRRFPVPLVRCFVFRRPWPADAAAAALPVIARARGVGGPGQSRGGAAIWRMMSSRPSAEHLWRPTRPYMLPG